MESIQQFERSGIAIDIDADVWSRIARKELQDAQGIGRMTGADDRDFAASGLSTPTRRKMNARMNTSLSSASF